MWRLLFLVSLLISIGACSPNNRLSRDRDQPPLYIAHHYSIDEEVGMLWGRHGLADFPPAVLLLSGLTQSLSPTILGQNRVDSLFAEFSSRGVMPTVFYAFYASGDVFDDICNGKFDQELTAMATTFADYPGEIYLAIGYQPNNAILPTPVDQFLPGYDCLQKFLESQGLKNVRYGVYLFGQGTNFRRMETADWYPENSRVDWMGTTGHRLTSELMERSLRFKVSNHDAIFELAESRGHPIYILEADPITLGNNAGPRGDSLYQQWYVPTLDYVKNERRILGFGHNSRYIRQDTVIADRVTDFLREWTSPRQ